MADMIEESLVERIVERVIGRMQQRAAGAVDYVTTRQLSERTGLSVVYLELMRRRGDGPPFVKLGRRCVRYPVVGVEEWLASRGTK